MSGPICPDCSGLALQSVDERKVKCPICGFEGRDLPRKIMMTEMQNELSDETQENLRLRKEGKLFFLRVFTQATEKQKDAIIDKLFDVFKLTRLSTGGPVLVIPRPEKPSVEIIAELKAMKGVKDVTVF